MSSQDLVERLRASLSYDTPARYPDMVTEAANEIERLRRFLGIAVDAYEDEHGFPTRETHWAAQAKKALGE